MDLVAEYNRSNARYFDGDQRIIKESAIKLENQCEMLATFLRYTREEHFQRVNCFSDYLLITINML